MGHTNEGEEVVTKYVNTLKYSIHDRLSLLKFRKVYEAYQIALNAEEKLSRNTSTSSGNSIAQSKKYASSRE